ncbi:MAG: M28 family peptidase, partial [Phormidesmis sp.]
MSVTIWGNPIASLVTAPPAAPPILPAPAADGFQRLELTVEAARLMTHVEAIARPRSTAPEKTVARSYITNALTGYGLLPQPQPYGSADQGGVNIVAEIPGRDPLAGTVVLGAHYDTPPNSPGADDNGSAIATLLEAARLFSAQTAARPAATLKLVFFDQEEQQADGSGLLGSSAFTAVEANIA